MHLARRSDRPHVVQITCHDLGRFLGCYGVETVRTPNLDRMGAEGVRFELRQRLGEAAFAAAWDAGRVMSLDESIGYALEQRCPQSAERPPGHAHGRA